MKFQGRAWVFGDDINTDIIISGKYLREQDPRIWAEHIFEALNKDYGIEIKPGDIIVAGENFGCGSSREQAAIALKQAGISIIVAESFGRIFFRNALNIGLAVVVCPQIKDCLVSDQDSISVDLEKRELKFKENILSIEELPDFMMEILRAGGLIGYYNKFEARHAAK